MSKLYFIGGAPRSGKTTVIQRLIERKPMLAASTDAIRNVAKGVTNPEERPKLHKVDRGEYDSPKHMEMMREDPQAVLLHETLQSEEVWKSTLDFIGYYHRDGKDAAIEGVAVLPKEVAKLEYEYSAIFLAPKGDQTKTILEHAKNNEFDWLHKYDDEVIKSFCDFIKHWNSYYSAEAKMAGLTIVEIDPDNFDTSINKAVDILLN